jgi:hypothetical protein
MPPSSQSPSNDRKPSEAKDGANHKRKSSASAHDPKNSKDEEDSASGNGKKKRRKVNHACVYCRRSHMTCDLERPCARCVKRDIGHLCHDEPREGAGRRSESGVEIAPAAPAQAGGDANGDMNGGMGGMNMDGSSGAGPQLAQPTPVSPVQTTTLGGLMPPNFDWNNSGVHNQFQDMHHLHPNYTFNTSEITNEYNFLNDFLSSSLIDDPTLYAENDAQNFLTDPLLSTSSMNALSNSFSQQAQQAAPNQMQPFSQQPPTLQQPQRPPTSNDEISRPPSTHPTTEAGRNKFYLTAADPAGLSSAEDRLHKLLKAKYDAGMLKPFNYVRGYARMNTYMSSHLSRQSQMRILKQLDRFRPKFREAMKNLTDMQLVLVEMWFERSLMEYDRVFASMAIPACCWRRTGEIFRGNREMAALVGCEWEKLRDGRMAIHEILGEESLVSYWEKFGAIAFDSSQKAILTSCTLKKLGKKEGEEEETIKCCFSFTIRRDTHNM